MRVDLDELPSARTRSTKKSACSTRRRRLPGRARRTRQVPNHPRTRQMAGPAQAGRAQPVLRHRRPRRPGAGNPQEGQPALVAVGADLSARHGAGDTRRTTVSRALGAAESPVSSRVSESMADTRQQQEKPPVLRLASASPRRRQLLDLIGVPHVVTPADIDETPRAARARRRVRHAAGARKGRGRLGAAQRSAGARRRHHGGRRRARSSASRNPKPTRTTMLGQAVGPRAPRAHRHRAVATARSSVVGISTTRVTFPPLSRASRSSAYWAERRAAGQGGRVRDPGTRRRVRDRTSPAATPASWDCRCSRRRQCCVSAASRCGTGALAEFG